MTSVEGASPSPGPMSAKRRPWLLGCGGCASMALGLVLLLVLAGGLAFWRRSGEPVRFEVQLAGAPLPATAGVVATYRPEADIPFVTRGLLGTTPTIDVAATASAHDGWLSVELEDGWPSIRDERLHFVSMTVGSTPISFGPIYDPQPFGPPELRSGGYVNPLEWAELDGEVATIRTHALFLPSGISYDARARTVRAIVDVRPIPAVRLAPGSQITAPPGAATEVRVTASRSGQGWPAATLASSPAPGVAVEAVIVSGDHLAETLGWATGFSPYIPVDPTQWRALAAHADARFALTVEPTAAGATLRFTTPVGIDAAEDWHLVAVAFAPGDTLAGAAEAYVTLENYDEDTEVDEYEEGDD